MRKLRQWWNKPPDQSRNGDGAVPGAHRAEAETRVVLPVIRRGAGCHLYDQQGREFIDYTMGWGAILLGYGAPAVEAAIAKQLGMGTLFSYPTELEHEVAERLCQLIPCAEQVWFGKNGSDACTAAVRIARAATGRWGLALCKGHYHGFHDWYVSSLGSTCGLPPGGNRFIHMFEYNNLNSLHGIFRKMRGQIAAVMLEPVRDQEPVAGYLEAIRELAHREGALLIFDEMITGLRLAPGGAQEHFGVTPDLACFGKSLANGLPLSLMAGPRYLICLAPRTNTTMTFQSEQLALAAAGAVIDVIEDGAVCRQLWDAGEELKKMMTDVAMRAGLRFGIGGPAPRQSFWFESPTGCTSARLMECFLVELQREGVLCNGNLLPSAAHDAAALAETARAVEGAMGAVAEKGSPKLKKTTP